MVRLVVAVFVLAAFAAGPNRSFAVTFADGQVHVIDATNNFPLEDVIVEDGPGGAATTVEMVGGSVGSAQQLAGMRVFGRSIAIIAGGTIWGPVLADDNSRVSIIGGSLLSFVRVRDESVVNMAGGQVHGVIEAEGAPNLAEISISGGIVGGLASITGSPRWIISDGIIEGRGVDISGGGAVEILGGNIGRVQLGGFTSATIRNGQFLGEFSTGNGSLEILGGTFHAQIYMSSSDVAIFGGQLDGQLLAVGTAVVTITGREFNLSAGEVLGTTGTLTGFLADGTPLSASFERATTARIVLDGSFEDADSDGIAEALDNCPSLPNADQADTDSNAVGDACNDAQDADGDEWADTLDNCPAVPNANQADRDLDLLGDACDLCADYRTSNNNDFDHNGIGDPCECGDQTQDAVVNVIDLVAINAAIFGVVQKSPLCDTNFDGKCNVSDIVGANRKIFGHPAYCSRYPPPGQ